MAKILLRLSRQQVLKEYKELPTRRGWPLFGNVFEIRTAILHRQGMEWSRDLGEAFRMRIFSINLVLLNSRRTIVEVLDDRSDSCNWRPGSSVSEVLNASIACNTELAFCSKQKETLMEIICNSEKHVHVCNQGLYDILHERLTSHPEADVDPSAVVLKPYMVDLIAHQLIGETLGPDDPDRDVLWEFIDLLNVLIDPAVDGALRTFPFLRRLPGYYGNIYRQTITARDKVAKRFYEDQKASYRPGNIRGLVDVCIMNQQEDLSKTGNSWLTDEHIKGLIYDTLAAGMTEILKTLRLFLLLMCHHPEVQSRLQAEVDTIIGTERFPSPEDRQWMPYAQAVMLEIWRYGSQTPLAIPHLCRKDIVLDGYLIEAGTVIFPNLYAVHHDEAIWGDPWEFRPERFLNEAGELLPPDHTLMQNVIPFSVGKRACPGQDFARSRIFVTMTSLMQRVRVVPPENSKMPPADPRLYTKAYPMTEPQFECRFLSRENIII